MVVNTITDAKAQLSSLVYREGYLSGPDDFDTLPDDLADAFGKGR